MPAIVAIIVDIVIGVYNVVSYLSDPRFASAFLAGFSLAVALMLIVYALTEDE